MCKTKSEDAYFKTERWFNPYLQLLVKLIGDAGEKLECILKTKYNTILNTKIPTKMMQQTIIGRSNVLWHLKGSTLYNKDKQ